MKAQYDDELRQALFAHIDSLVARYGELLPHRALTIPFTFEEKSFRPLQQAGIFKPSSLGLDGAALVLLSSLDGPYDDQNDLESDIIQYRYQGDKGDEDNYFNRSLRQALIQRKPILYLWGFGNNEYLPLYPAYIINDHRQQRYVDVVIGNRTLEYRVGADEGETSKFVDAVRAYSTVQAKRRLHQAGFKKIVMQAYKSRCAMCSLNLPGLVDAAHIIPDSEPLGDPIVPNGLALCKIHHSAFDSKIIGVDPTYHIHVKENVLNQVDGPMLYHGIQQLQGKTIDVPSKKQLRPDPERLKVVWNGFLASGSQ
jgi:putative restriction endonuclease